METTEERRSEIHERMRTELSSSLVDYLDAAQWQGRGYASVRNTYLLDAYLDELPDELRSLRAFSSEDQRLTLHSDAESERILKRAESLHESPDDT